MSTLTPNYDFILPGVGDPTDQDLWGGYLNANWSSLDTLLAAVSLATQLPVGSLYFNADDGTNPGTLLGYGTWVAYAQGRVPVGVGTGTDENAVDKTVAAEEEYGEYEHVQTIAEIAPHTHTLWQQENDTQSGINDDGQVTGEAIGREFTTAETGDGTAMQWSQPSIGVYIWKRTA